MSTRTRVKASVEDTTPEPQELGLQVKYRPQTLDDVIGQAPVVKSLRNALELKALPHAYLFTGPAGTGKTTLARIAARALGIAPEGVIEIDAASNTGIDSMRAVLETIRYQGFGSSPRKMILVDEAHGLSKAAMDSMLKAIEEPPEHVFFALCTTNPSKIPATIVSRCASFELKPMRRDDMLDLLELVCDGEKFDTPSRHLGMIADAADGCPRLALSMLAAVHRCDTDEECAAILSRPMERKEIIDVCRALVKGSLKWDTLTGMLKELQEPAETVRIVIVNYLGACLMGAKSDKDVMLYSDMLRPFMQPFQASDKNAPLLMAFSQIMYPD